MVASKKIICAFVLLISICVSSYAGDKRLLVDEAGVLEAKAFAKIEKHLKTISEKSKSEAVVVIVSDAEGKTPEAYADDYFDYNDYGLGDEKEGSLLLIITGDGTQGSRYAHISTHGKKTIETITDGVIEKLLDALIDGGLKKNDYPKGIESYLSTLSGRFYNSLSLMEVGISLGLALLTFLLKFFGTISKYKSKGNFAAAPFYDIGKNSLVSFATNNDTFLTSNTTSHIIQSNKGKGGFGTSTTHTSSSGKTHGGGGRSF